jgi:formate hydrogenlyase subunit 3/multisubunit Na+/H+ antiporter MnhD subunit
MCKCIAATAAINFHLYLLGWQVTCAIPTVVLFANVPAEFEGRLVGDDGHPGIAFFCFVLASAIVGFWLVVLRECCACLAPVRWLEQAAMLVYILAELVIFGWSIAWAVFYIRELQSEMSEAAKAQIAWFYLGAIGSVVLAFFSLLVILSAWWIMRDGHSERAAAREKARADSQARADAQAQQSHGGQVARV